MSKHRIPAAFLAHPPPSWRKTRRNPPIIGGSTNTIMGNAKRRGVYLSPEWHHFVKRKPRTKKNPYRYRRNPGGGSMMTWVLLGGAAFLFLTPTGRAMAARFTGGIGLPAGIPAGSVRLPDGTYRTPTGQIIGTPISGAPGYLAPLASLVPGITATVGGWLSGLFSSSSATTPGTIITSEPPGAGDLSGTHDILTGGYQIGDPLPPIPDLVLGSPGSTDFWSGIDTSGWWGNIGVPIDPFAGPVPVLDLSLSPVLDAPDPALMDAVSGFMGYGQVQHAGPTGRYRFRQPPSFR
jgi:hypothetical protein